MGSHANGRKNNPALKGSNIEREKSGIDVKIAEGMKLPKIDLWANTTLSEYPSTVVPKEAGVFPPSTRTSLVLGSAEHPYLHGRKAGG